MSLYDNNNTINFFLPKYPQISKSTDNLFNPYSSSFNQSISDKKEFLKLDKSEIKKTSSNYLQAQQNIARYMNEKTGYNSVLLFWQMGSGKTCAAVAIAEGLKGIKNEVIILASSRHLLKNFRKSIIYDCAKSTYYKCPDNSTIEECIRESKRMIKKYYTFKTYDTMYKIIRNLSDESLLQKFRDKIFILDEVHNIRETDQKDEDDKYSQIHRLLHISDTNYTVLLSGTPMKDVFNEIVDVMNLILPLDQQFNSKKFVTTFFEKDGDKFKFKKSFEEIFKQKILGKVSYLKTIDSNVKTEFIGDIVFNKFKILETIMSKFQNEHYIPTYIDNESFGINMREASLFVYPDGTYGSRGFKKYMIKNSMNDELKKILTKGVSISYTSRNVSDDDKNIILKNLEKYSCKYSACIKNLINETQLKSKSFVYCDVVNGSGLVLFASILSLFGYSRGNGRELDPDNRYIFLKNGVNLDKLVSKFNSDVNVNGRLYSVLIGSGLISEGYTFKDVEFEHILAPAWNYTRLDQAIARGIRYGSHDRLLKVKEEVVVKVYLYAAVPVSDSNKSIDLRMYKISEEKDVNIKIIEKAIKEVSFDCKLNYERNSRKNDYSRECEYDLCKYECYEIDSLDDKVDDITYNIYYNEEDKEIIKEKIIDIFKNVFEISIFDIFVMLNMYNQNVIMSVLCTIIFNNEIVQNKFGINCYVREHENVLYVVNDISNQEILLSYYTKNPNYTMNNTFESVLTDVKDFNKQNIVDSFCETKDISLIDNMPNELKSFILESIIVSKKPSVLKTQILKYFDDNVKKNENITFVIFGNFFRCLKDGVWSDCTNEDKTVFNKIKNKKMKNMKNVPYIGMISDGTFILKKNDLNDDDVDRRKHKRGMACTSYKKEDIIDILKDNDIYEDEDDKLSRKMLCEKIQKFFQVNDLMI